MIRSKTLGYTFWNDDGLIMSSASFKDGTYDLQNQIPVCEWDSLEDYGREQLTELLTIIAKLTK